MKKFSLLPYRQAIPSLLLFDLISFGILQLWLLMLNALSRLLLSSAGRVSVTSGDLKFLFTTPQGYALILLGLLTLYFFLGIEFNALIILCGRLLRGEKPMVFKSFVEGIVSLRRFFGPRGLLIVLYLSLLAPLLNIGISISLTRNLYIPNFISSVIFKNPLYVAAFVVLSIGLLCAGIIFIFILHGTLLDDMSLKDSAKNSIRLVKSNIKSLIPQLLRFSAIYTVLIALPIILFVILPMAFVPESMSNLLTASRLTVGFMYTGLSLALLIVTMSVPFLMLKLTGLYMTYQSDGEWVYQKRKGRVSALVIILAVLYAALGVFFVFGVPWAAQTLFPQHITTGIIAHRAGGVEAPENTLAGIDAAYRLGAYGSEIDIQRTADGHYIVLHDDDFNRVCSVNKKPGDMTLDEVRTLRVDGEPVPTLEEMLESCRDRVILFVELKGATADRKMADDAVRIVKEHDMLDGAVLISLKYDLIDYIETTYPEIQTGYLAFASFGDTASLNCDSLALEEETATPSTIEAIHEKGKKIYVWTVNDSSDLERFLQSGADAVITDNISDAVRITEQLETRSPYERIVDGMLAMFTQ